MPDQSSANLRAGLALGAIGVLVFGGTLPASRVAVAEMDPVFVTAGRALVAGAVAIPVLWLGRAPWPARRHWPTLLWIALMLVAGFPLFAAIAMLYAPSSHGAVVLGVLPLATAVSGAVFAGERPSPAFWLLATAGAGLVLAYALIGIDEGLALGDLALGGAIVAGGVGYALSGRLAREIGGWQVISWALVISLPASALGTFAIGVPAPAAVSAGGWLAFAYLALMSQFLGFFAWNRGLALGGIARIGQLQLLQTFVTLAMAALILGERVDATTIAFAAAVVLVVAAGQRARVGTAGVARGG